MNMDERRLFTGRLVAAGETRTMTEERGGYVMTAEAIRGAIDQGLFNGLACFVDHAAEGPSIRRLVGVWQGVVWDEEARAAEGRLLAYETAETRPVLDLLEQWLDEGEARSDIGVSLVFWPRLAADGRTVQAIVMVESADLVMFPASVDSRILERGGGAASSGMGLSGRGGTAATATVPGATGEASRVAVVAPWIRRRAEGNTSHSLLNKPHVGNRQPSHTQATTGHVSIERELQQKHSSHNQAELPQTGNDQREHTRHQPNPYDPNGRPSHWRDQAVAIKSIKQEKQPMKQEMKDDGLPRLTLVRHGSEAMKRVNLAAGQALEPVAAESAADGWLEALQAAATTAVIRSSGLPAVVQERLANGRYESAEAVQAAVEQARDELAALSAAGVVRLGNTGRPRIQVRDPLDEAQDVANFLFGAEGASIPSNMRRVDEWYKALTGDFEFRGTFNPDRVQFAGATTSTLSNTAVNAMNKVLVEQISNLTAWRWYESITSVEPNDGSLNAMQWITIGGISNLPTVAEGAAYTELTVDDVKESSSFTKRGGYVGITRELLKNSDIAKLQAIPRALATAAIRSRSAAVSEIFTQASGTGPTLAQDSTVLFHSNHGNVNTTAIGTDAAAWRAARYECFLHTDVNSGKPLGIFPRFLLVPAELYDVALSILGYGEGMPTTYAPEAQDRGFADPRAVPLVVPDWTDATDWAYIVDPKVFPVIQMSYSQNPGGRNHPAPELFAVTGETNGLLFTNDTLPIKVRDEFAVGVNGPRGIGKRNVAN